MNSWVPNAIIAALFFSAANAFIKIYQPKLGNGFGLFFFVFGGLIATAFITFVLKIDSNMPKQFGTTPYIAMLAGILWAIANFFFFSLFSKNTPLSIAMPFVVGGIGVGGILAGVLFFGERMNASQIAGAVIVLIGSAILAR